MVILYLSSERQNSTFITEQITFFTLGISTVSVGGKFRLNKMTTWFIRVDFENKVYFLWYENGG